MKKNQNKKLLGKKVFQGEVVKDDGIENVGKFTYISPNQKKIILKGVAIVTSLSFLGGYVLSGCTSKKNHDSILKIDNEETVDNVYVVKTEDIIENYDYENNVLSVSSEEEQQEEILETIEEEAVLKEVGEFTVGELETNMFLLNLDIDDIYNTMDKDVLEFFYADGKETYKNKLENMSLVLNGYQPHVADNKIFNVSADVHIPLANIASMKFANIYNRKTYMAELDMRNFVHNLSDAYIIIDILENHISNYINGVNMNDNVNAIMNVVDIVAKGFEGVYEVKYDLVDGECLPMDNPNYKEENIIKLEGYNRICGEVIEIDLSKLTDGEALIISSLMSSAVHGTLPVLQSNGATFQSLNDIVMDFYFIPSTAIKNIERDIDNYKEVESLKEYPETSDLNNVLLGNYRELISKSATQNDKVGYIGDMYNVMKKINASLEELIIINEDEECEVIINDRYCTPSNIITFVKATADTVVVEVDGIEYVGINEKVETVLLIERIVNSGLISNDLSYFIDYGTGSRTEIKLDDVRELIDVTYNSLMRENRIRKEEVENIKQLTK